MTKKTVTIFGTSKAEPGERIYETARQLGAALAQAGCAIANGGYGGTMLAAAEGATGVGGTVYGVTCTAFGRKGPNRYITEEISTASLAQRIAKLIELGDAYIVLAGGTGTLLELAQVWELKNKGFAGADKPIILLGNFWRPLPDMMVSVDRDCVKCVTVADSPSEAVEIVISYEL